MSEENVDTALVAETAPVEVPKETPEEVPKPEETKVEPTPPATEEDNEFAELDEEEFLDGSDAANASDTPPSESSGDLIGDSNAGTVYDMNSAPDSVRAPDRVEMDGMEITIDKAEIVLPPADKPWGKTRDGTKDVKNCIFRLYYSHEGQQEAYSGVRVFRAKDPKTGKYTDLYTHPTIYKTGGNQAAKLFQTYAEYKGKSPKEVSLKEFLAYLQTKPKALIQGQDFKNPETNDVVKKNIVTKFL